MKEKFKAHTMYADCDSCKDFFEVKSPELSTVCPYCGDDRSGKALWSVSSDMMKMVDEWYQSSVDSPIHFDSIAIQPSKINNL